MITHRSPLPTQALTADPAVRRRGPRSARAGAGLQPRAGEQQVQARPELVAVHVPGELVDDRPDPRLDVPMVPGDPEPLSVSHTMSPATIFVLVGTHSRILTADGTSVSSAVRAAVIGAAQDRRVASLRAEARDLAEDEADRAEMAAVLRDMDSLRAW